MVIKYVHILFLTIKLSLLLSKGFNYETIKYGLKILLVDIYIYFLSHALIKFNKLFQVMIKSFFLSILFLNQWIIIGNLLDIYINYINLTKGKQNNNKNDDVIICLICIKIVKFGFF